MAIRIRKRLTKRELIFNIISLSLVIIIGLYFGIRSFYYYGKQNKKVDNTNTTLSDKIINNNRLTKDKDGWHQDTKGYYFKGEVENNYVRFANRDFRVIRVNNDNTVKLVSEDITSIFMWGEKIKYKDSNLNNWLNKTDDKHSGIYYDTIPKIKEYLVKTKYSEDKLSGSKVKDNKTSYKDYVTTLTIKDYITAGGKNSYLNTGKYYWLIGHDKDKMNLYVNEEGEVESSPNSDTYGVKVVITLDKNTTISDGDGSKANPYVVNQNSDTNYINKYVKLGNDTYIVSSDKDNKLKLVSANYINNDFKYSFSKTTSGFNLMDFTSLAYYLNNTYYNTLSYKDKLLDINNYIGELSNDAGIEYSNIFKSNVPSKIGLLNMFDYNPTDLTDFYLVNDPSTTSTMSYVYNNLGILEEDEITNEKHIVTTIMISKKSIKKGDGTKEKPYTVE